MKTTVYVNPIGKPRMTKRDKWAKRPCVMRYWAFKDALKTAIPNPDKDAVSVSWRAFIAIPDSCTKKEYAARKGQLHRMKPDRDNIDKAILDALFKDDSGISCGYIEKRWDDGNGPRIEIEIT